MKLKKLRTWVNQRRKIAKIYNKFLLETSLILPKENKKNFHSYHAYIVQHKKREFIINRLKKNNIFCNILYPFPIHLMRGYSFLKYRKGDFPVAEKLSKHIFSLPMYPTLKYSAIFRIIKCLKEVSK